MFPGYIVSQVYPQASSSIFIAFYNSQGYGGGILILLHIVSFSKNSLFHGVN
jgi:hypothetical protein